MPKLCGRHILKPPGKKCHLKMVSLLLKSSLHLEPEEWVSASVSPSFCFDEFKWPVRIRDETDNAQWAPACIFNNSDLYLAYSIFKGKLKIVLFVVELLAITQKIIVWESEVFMRNSMNRFLTYLNPLCAWIVFDFMRTDLAAEIWRGKCRRRPQQVVSAGIKIVFMLFHRCLT